MTDKCDLCSKDLVMTTAIKALKNSALTAIELRDFKEAQVCINTVIAAMKIHCDGDCN